jgi:[acyl-carrier-protein] S-malonyltransferase
VSASDLEQQPPAAFLFAGQGSQVTGMGSALAATCDDCRATLQAADEALGFPLSRIMADGPDAELQRTVIAQPALMTLAVAHARHLQALGIRPALMAGHSLGQLSALVVAGALDFAAAVRLVAERGKLMQETVAEGEGAMQAIIGLERDDVYAACAAARHAGVVNVACHNAPGQTVISGSCAAVAAAADLCERKGGGVTPLPVSAPFHCDLLLSMVPAFGELINATEISDPAIPVIDNVTAVPLHDAPAVRQSLIAQITAPVLMEESLRYLTSAGIRRYIQCGPGTTLLGFARKVCRSAWLQSFEDAATTPCAGA